MQHRGQKVNPAVIYIISIPESEVCGFGTEYRTGGCGNQPFNRPLRLKQPQVRILRTDGEERDLWKCDCDEPAIYWS